MIASILKSVKKTLGLDPEAEEFDDEIVLFINSALSTLTQIGVGPPEGFSIEGPAEEWTTFLGSDPGLNSAKEYVFLRVRLMFDPPPTQYMSDAMQKQVNEKEWRLNVHVENLKRMALPYL